MPTISSAPYISYLINYFIPLIYLLINFKSVSVITKRQSILLFLLLLLFIISILVPIFHETNDFSYLTVSSSPLRNIPVYLFLYTIVFKKYKNNKPIDMFIYYFILTHVLYVIVTMLFVFSPSIKNAWFSVFSKNIISDRLLESFGYTFRIGWIGFSGFRITMYCTLCTILTLYLLKKDTKSSVISKKILYFAYIMCIIGNIFYGRIGIIVSIISNVIILIKPNKIKIKQTLIILMTILSMTLFIASTRNIEPFRDLYIWALTPIKNLITRGEFDNYSVNNMKKMNVVPTDETLMLGDGYFTYDNKYYMETDLGYLRNIYYWGIICTIIAYATTYYSLKGSRKVNKQLFLSLLVAVTMFEIKGISYFEFIPILFIIDYYEILGTKGARLND